MNPVLTSSTSVANTRRRRRTAVVAIAGLAFISAGAVSATTVPPGTEPMESHPMTSEPMESHPMTSEPMESHPMTSEPMESHPMTSEPMDDMTGPHGVACAAVPTEGEGSVDGMADDPVATAASNNPLLTTLVSAVGAAGLVDTLNGPGPFTVFAPINTAFDKVPPDTLAGVLADVDALSGILTYHVIPEQLSSADLVAGGTFTTVNGADLTVAQVGETLVVNDGAAAVVCADVPTANATVYLIDTVLMPPA